MAEPIVRTPVVSGTAPQPPATGPVTHATNPAPASNIISKSEAKQQAQVREGAGDVMIPTDYHFTIERGSHKVDVVVEQGMNYNFHVVCEGCDWEGRYLHQDPAEEAAKDHLDLKFPNRG